MASSFSTGSAASGTLLGLAWLLARIARTLEALLQSLATRTEAGWDDVLLPFAGKALRLILPMLALILGTPALAVSEGAQQIVQNAVSLALIGTIGFILVQFVDAMAQLVLSRYSLDVADNRVARGVYTQVMVLKKIAVGVIAVFAIASMLMVFQSVRQLGTAMIASAGVAGIVIGFAAQKSLGTLLAGFQIAMTQPIRIDDVVIVEGEWGRIEEITLTYVVVCIWDLRRLVVPITYFIEKPFQNWTRTSADILGTVFLQVDYGVPVDAVRAGAHADSRGFAALGSQGERVAGDRCEGAHARAARARQLERCQQVVGPALRDARKARGVHSEELSRAACRACARLSSECLALNLRSQVRS